MDLWVLAAAAGAGYLAKYWQHISKDKDGTLGFSSEESFPIEHQNPSLIERIRDKACPIKKFSRARAENGMTDHLGEISSETLNNEQEVGRNDGRDGQNKKSRRSRRLHLPYIKPNSSLDSCLMAQMHGERGELEKYLLTPLSSPCTPSLRPFLVSDGKRIISRPSGELLGGIYTKVHRKADIDGVGVPRLPQISELDFSTKKLNNDNQMEKSHDAINLVQFGEQAGFSSGHALFCLGMSIGILSTIIANKVELERLKVTLKESENLVDDLQEELEMKDSLTVKELVNDDDSQEINGNLSGNEIKDVFSSKGDVNDVIRYADEEESVSLKKDESISNIEAELEAELERLELSMKGSNLSSELNQGFDQEVIAELVQGELLADLVRKRSSSEHTIDHDCSSSTPTPQSTINGVCPRQLSLRLYELIQSRLEERVMELEDELAKSQKHINQLLTERSSPRAREARIPVSQPIVMNLSGDALDAYNEAFEELSKVNEEPDSNRWVGGKREEAIPISITGIPSSEDSPNECDEGYDDDEDDMLLIMQIVEKARQGSPAVLMAQKAIYGVTE